MDPWQYTITRGGASRCALGALRAHHSESETFGFSISFFSSSLSLSLSLSLLFLFLFFFSSSSSFLFLFLLSSISLTYFSLLFFFSVITVLNINCCLCDVLLQLLSFCGASLCDARRLLLHLLFVDCSKYLPCDTQEESLRCCRVLNTDFRANVVDDEHLQRMKRNKHFFFITRNKSPRFPIDLASMMCGLRADDLSCQKVAQHRSAPTALTHGPQNISEKDENTFLALL